MDQDIWGNDNDDDSKKNVRDDFKTSNYNNNNDDDDMFANKESNNRPNAPVMNGNHDITDVPTSNLLSYFDSGNDINTDVRIVNTEERKGKITKYTVYIIESSIFGASTSVARRYNDFKWLYSILGIEFVGIFIPPLAPSNVFERFKDEIISQRRYDLERFLNRINDNKILKTSSSFELFLCEQSEQIFEEQKKIHKKQLVERTDYDIISLLMRSFQGIDEQEIPEWCLGFGDDNNYNNNNNNININNNDNNNDYGIDDDDEDNLHKLDIPRLREFFMRCDERFIHLNKISTNLFRIFTNICTELNIFNQNLCELYDAEYNDKPQFMINSCQQRHDVRDFMNKWKELEQVQMDCFYKSFLLNLRYEHEDIKSILDSFKRYDVIYNKYKKLKTNLKKSTDKYPDKDYEKEEQELNETKSLLDIICKIMLIDQTPKLWNKKIKNYNNTIQKYIDTVTEKAL